MPEHLHPSGAQSITAERWEETVPTLLSSSERATGPDACRPNWIYNDPFTYEPRFASERDTAQS